MLCCFTCRTRWLREEGATAPVWAWQGWVRQPRGPPPFLALHAASPISSSSCTTYHSHPTTTTIAVGIAVIAATTIATQGQTAIHPIWRGEYSLARLV